jgi:hypothetical protein
MRKIIITISSIIVYGGVVSTPFIIDSCLYKPVKFFGKLTINNGTYNDLTINILDEDEFNELCVRGNATTTINVQGLSFLKSEIVDFKFGNGFNLHKIPDYFMSS